MVGAMHSRGHEVAEHIRSQIGHVLLQPKGEDKEWNGASQKTNYPDGKQQNYGRELGEKMQWTTHTCTAKGWQSLPPGRHLLL